MLGPLRPVDVRHVGTENEGGLVAAGAGLQEIGLSGAQLDRVGIGRGEGLDRGGHVLDPAQERGQAGEAVIDGDVDAAARGGMEQAVEAVCDRHAGLRERMLTT